AVNVPLSQLAERIGTLPQDRPLVVHCASDYRSAIAASMILRDGRPEVAVLVGGLPAAESAPLATVAA
ncbi:MAG TPA: rhodanese-like domain-containing protein, partial [Gemmatimonadales bacterium]|nr:rhodanese-like domain-containing protein [Gemmatimonadales bacterium]